MITSFNPFSLSIVFVSILSFLNLTTPATGANYLFHFCANSTFSANSLYQTGINSLLSSLSSNATRNLEFYNTTTNRNTSNPVYGLYLCRGDVTSEVCRGCVAEATKDLTTRCSREKIAVIWYDECMIRYSNESIFSTVIVRPRVALLNTQNITNQDQLNKLVNTSMTSLASKASDVPIGVKKFRTEEVNISAFQTLYNLVQCTPDLSSTDCNLCLQTAIIRLPICCGGKQGARVLLPSCNVRYELYRFYNTPEAPSPSPGLQSLPPPPSVSGQEGKSKMSTATVVAIVAPIFIAVVLFIVGCCFLTRRGKKNNNVAEEADAANDITTVESLQFDFVTIESATNKFSEDNKLGEGGFGQVYKGTLPNRQEIAVKRLSKSSGQGAEQFKNEVVVVAQLQHRNLARLLGFCLEGEEKILVYEFVPNKSLDYILYDPKKKGLLDWSRRYKIIDGIARGIQYLHQDSRLRIIHRDLKASNILLDADMNPKISDFGMARIFGVDQTQGNTSRIVGTYGYMSPEYAMHGEFSMKSDVYSFGVLVLEIISGKKNSDFYESEGAEDLLSYTWKQWKNGTPIELLDPTIRGSHSRNEVIRCIHIGLLCVQENPANRPTMATVVLMLDSYSVSLQLPQQPAFLLRNKANRNMPKKELQHEGFSSQSVPWSVDGEPITELYPR
ncbi:cysteine-rich receptor-like protein kinase 25 isoform X1 [Quercus robur]|uniref:cysteine-rich receptor-like protein kinase 25 isoform X1 n=1 Tax=Quercus robur TaxID=38942 RepID=UPI0021626A90|nr:cysteine-rich receptor-like protein kinase 25 isoform X1 [Quercus robur]